jgi:gamma-glutamylcysteine synthetase
MNRQDTLDLLYEKYIAPTKKNSDLWIGVEFEMPIVNLKKEAVDFAVVHDLTRKFENHFGFHTAVLDESGESCSLIEFKTDDILSYDCSYNNLELSFGKEADLNAIQERFSAYYLFINEILHESDYTLTGLGINPYRKYNSSAPILNGRYRMLYHHLTSYEKYLDRIPMFFHHYPDYGMFASASQVQLDVGYDALIPTIKAFSLLEPLKALLFSNSVLNGEHEELICCRDMLWENSTHGINPHNIGMFDDIPENVEELLEYIASTSIYCTEQDGKYINFEPIKIVEYFARDEIEGEYYDKNDDSYHCIIFRPRKEDLTYLRSFKFEDITFRGTIEFRSVCCQPIRDALTVAAFHLGLIRQPEKLNAILENDHVIYGHGYNATELRKLFNQRGLPNYVDKNALKELLSEVLELSRSGLKERGRGEEVYLDPLFERAKHLTNPATRLLESLEAGIDVEETIRDYATIS